MVFSGQVCPSSEAQFYALSFLGRQKCDVNLTFSGEIARFSNGIYILLTSNNSSKWFWNDSISYGNKNTDAENVKE